MEKLSEISNGVKTLKDFNFKGKRVLVRCDFNVPFDEKGNIRNDFRIEKTIPTIKYLADKEAKVILMSHLGKPLEEESFEQAKQKYSLKPMTRILERFLGKKVGFLVDCVGQAIESEIGGMEDGEIILLENLRFHKEEEENNEDFARKLAKLGDLYINDAFSVSHRAHASTAGVPKYLPSAAGLLLEQEIKALSMILENHQRPLVTIIGGAKISTKIAVIEQFLKSADHLLLGGEIANAILIMKRISVGRQLVEDEETKNKIDKIGLTDPKLHLPVDGIFAPEKNRENYSREGAIASAEPGEKIFDIGPETIKLFSDIIKEANMVLWSGPLGMYEEKLFEKGTKEIAESIIKNKSAFKIVGGGDTVSAINKFGLLSEFNHVSTGGGAMLEFLAGEKLPGIEALRAVS